jgi:thiol:disulfide interchange protein
LILNIMPCVFPVLGIKVTSVVQQAGEDRRKVVLHGLMYTVGILLSFWVLGGLAIALNKGWGFAASIRELQFLPRRFLPHLCA